MSLVLVPYSACGCVTSQPTTFTNVATKRREYVQDKNQAELTTCSHQVEDLQRQVSAQKSHLNVIVKCSLPFSLTAADTKDGMLDSEMCKEA